MGFLDAFGMGGEKTTSKSTQPWNQQYGLWTLLSLISPEFADAFKSAKPKMFKQVFEGSSKDERAASPLSRILTDYDPFDFITKLGRPTTEAEQSLMDRSLFGAAAPLDLSRANAQADRISSRLEGFSPDAPGGGALGKGYQELLAALGGPVGGGLPQVSPQRPQRPMMPPPPQMGIFGQPQGAGGMKFTGGGNSLWEMLSPTRPQFM